MSAAILQVQDVVVQHLTFVEQLILNEMVADGAAVVVKDMPGQLAGAQKNGIRASSH
jgi:hypothetical protein